MWSCFLSPPLTLHSKCPLKFLIQVLSSTQRTREQIHQMHFGPLSPPAGGPSLILPDRNRLAQDLDRPPRGPPPIQNVIDLTDSPPPIPGLRGHTSRFGADGQTEVIDVDALPDQYPQRPRGPAGLTQSQQDIGLLFAQDVAQELLAGPSRLRLGGLQHRFSPPGPIEPRALYSQVEEDMRFQPRSFQEIEDPILGHVGRVRHQPEPANGFFTSSNRVGPHPAVANVLQFLRGVGRGPTTEYPDFVLPQQPPMGGSGFQPPGQLDYRRRAPGIIREDSPVIEDVIRTRNVDYKAPPPAREGYTRTPKGDDILVCSNCDVELGVESPNPSNEEVWASKCGHVRLLSSPAWNAMSLMERSVTAVLASSNLGRHT